MKKVLITGANGFIGSFLVEKALELGWEVWAGVRKSSNCQYLKDPRIKFIDLPFADEARLSEDIKKHISEYGKWDYIVHNLGITKCMNKSDFERVNYGFTKNFIEALQETAAIPDKFILMSSLSAVVPEKEQTLYGESKLKAEQLLRDQTAIPYIILRPTGVYGPREKDYYLVMKAVKSGLDVAAGMEVQQLTFIYVKDLVDLVYTALSSGIKNNTYAVAEGKVYTDEEYTQLTKQALGKKKVIKLRIPLPLVKAASIVTEDVCRIFKKTSTLNRDKYKIMARRDWSCDISDIERDFNFKAKYDLPSGLRETVEWYRKNGWI
ncbi:NAD(P)-dependent oxidoreductase [Bacteroidales bacterium OttesenSCG-928-I14]|nr:NAD(P)-dependent oxidoreductase [Bacteroidales bacterium OttesenSCG-928-I14]